MPNSPCTFIAGLRLSSMVTRVLDGPINGLAFRAYVDQVLASELREGDVVVMDNLGSHKGAGLRFRSRPGVLRGRNRRPS
jgi:hypothetical protein